VVFYVNGSSKGEAERRPVPGEPGSYIIEKTINLVPGENSVYFLVTNENKASIRSENRYFINPEATKPIIIWGNPARSNVSVNSDMINIEACIKSPTGLKSLKILVNGESQGEDNLFTVSGDPGCNIRWQRSIILKEGIDNSLYIIAENSAGAVT
jgi:hypothetical protein